MYVKQAVRCLSRNERLSIFPSYVRFDCWAIMKQLFWAMHHIYWNTLWHYWMMEETGREKTELAWELEQLRDARRGVSLT